jgi:hypothetical protein
MNDFLLGLATGGLAVFFSIPVIGWSTLKVRKIKRNHRRKARQRARNRSHSFCEHGIHPSDCEHRI